jgi:hypothetical protein
MMVAHEPKFLSENLIIVPSAGKGPKYLFLFPRSRGADVEQIVENLRERLGQRTPSGVEAQLQPASAD